MRTFHFMRKTVLEGTREVKYYRLRTNVLIVRVLY